MTEEIASNTAACGSRCTPSRRQQQMRRASLDPPDEASPLTLWVPITPSWPLTRCLVLDEGLPSWASGCVAISQSGTVGISCHASAPAQKV